jgi:hypothetical protein
MGGSASRNFFSSTELIFLYLALIVPGFCLLALTSPVFIAVAISPIFERTYNPGSDHVGIQFPLAWLLSAIGVYGAYVAVRTTQMYSEKHRHIAAGMMALGFLGPVYFSWVSYQTFHHHGLAKLLSPPVLAAIYVIARLLYVPQNTNRNSR